ncbi:MAG TPA: aldolase/citrate lyase family protein [Candidatus Dormibacteraeota bacterium]
MRELLQGHDTVLGAWANLSDPACVEIMGIAGLDYVFIDMEHNGLDMEGLKNHLRAARAFGLGSMVRVYTPEEKFVLRVLDCGAEGILAPHCATPEEARLAVEAVRYPPEGKRGYTMNSRGADYGGHGLGSNTEAAEALNRMLVVGIYIEDIAAVERIDEIVAVPGVDYCQIGPGDLSASMGYTGSVNHPEVVAAVDRVCAACVKAGISVGMTVQHPSYTLSFEDARAHGYKALIVGNDSGMLLSGFQARLASLRQPVA